VLVPQLTFCWVSESSGDHDPGRCLIKAGIGGENGSYKVIVDIKEDPRNIVTVYVVSSL
jgi:hypothetical protein